MGLLGWSKGDAWREFARQIRAEFIEGGLGRVDKVVGNVKQWIITLDTRGADRPSHSEQWIRMRAAYVSQDGLRFEVVHKGRFARLWRRLFGTKDIEVGYPEFDRHFITKADDESRVRALLANPRIRKLIQAQPGIRFKGLDVGGSPMMGEGQEDIDLLRERLSSKARTSPESWAQVRESDRTRVLFAEVDSVIKDVDRLKALFELFVETLNHLCRVGSASPEGAIAQDLKALVELRREDPEAVERILGWRMAEGLRTLGKLQKEDPQAAERIMNEIDSGGASMASLSTLVAGARQDALSVDKAEGRLRAEGRLPPPQTPPAEEA